MPFGMLQESDTFNNLPVFTNIYGKTLNSYADFVKLVKMCKAANSSFIL